MDKVNVKTKKPNNSSIKTVKPSFKSWNEDIERLVLYSDFMGFKERVNKLPHAELKRKMENFHDKWKRQMSPLIMNDNLRYAQFSDSILIVANGTNEKMFNLISKAAARLMHVALNEGIALKGVIAEGVFTYDSQNELYIGKPLVDAYLLHDEIKFYGIVVHHSAERTVKRYAADNDNPYTNEPIALEKGKTAHYHLCWNMMDKLLDANDYTEQCLKWLDEIAETVSGKPRIYIDNTVSILKADQKAVSERKKGKKNNAAIISKETESAKDNKN
jgi:hypothetical protein